MSLLLLSQLTRTKSAPDRGLVEGLSDETETQPNRNHAWLLSYIALFTSLLAFFILTISMLELETSAPKRSYQELIANLHKQFVYERNRAGIPWLQIDDSTTKGIKITLPADLVKGEALFDSAQAKINPRYLPYLRSMLEVVDALNVGNLRQQYRKLVQAVEMPGYRLKFMIRVEGHTDSNPMAATARFKNNVELSTYRAYAMMEWMRIHLGLPRDQFAIAGYGSFHPLVTPTTSGENRRIEIYLQPQLVKLAQDLPLSQEQE